MTINEHGFDSDILKEIYNNDPAVSIDENTFLREAIPCLFHDDPLLFNRYWLGKICDTPFQPVKIIDSAGKTVFTIPPLRRYKGTHARTVFVEALLSSVQAGTRHAAAQQRMIAESSDKLVDFNSLHIPKEHSDIWREILTHYGYKDLLHKVGLGNEEKTTTTDKSKPSQNLGMVEIEE